MTSGLTIASSSMLPSILSVIMRLRSSCPASEPVAPRAVMRWKCTDTPSGANAIISGSTVGFPGGSRKPSRALQPIIVDTPSDNAILAQPLYFFGADAAQLAQEGVGVFAEQWRARHLGRRIGQLDRVADGPVGAAFRVIDIEDHLTRLQMRVGEHLAGVLAGAARNSRLAQYLHNLVLAAPTRPFFNNRIQRLAVFPAHLRRIETRIVGQLGPAHCPCHARPHLLLRGDENIIVGAARRAGIGRPWHPLPHLVAASRHRTAKALMIAQADADQIDDRVLHRHLHTLAAARIMALLQRRKDADRHMNAGAGIADRRHDKGRRVFREAGDAHRPAHRLRDRLEALEIGIRPIAAEALDRRVDQTRVDLRQNLPAETQPVERPRAEILDHHIRLGDQLFEQLLAASGLQIQRQAALVGVKQQEEEAVAVLVTHVAARDVAALRLFELDHIGAEKAEYLRACRPRLIVGHVDDANARQRLVHTILPIEGPLLVDRYRKSRTRSSSSRAEAGETTRTSSKPIRSRRFSRWRASSGRQTSETLASSARLPASGWALRSTTTLARTALVPPASR